MQPLVPIQRTVRRYAVSPMGQPLCHRVHLRPERKVIRDPSEHLLTLDISESKCRKAIHAAAQEGAICNHSVPDGIKADCATKARVFLDRFCPPWSCGCQLVTYNSYYRQVFA